MINIIKNYCLTITFVNIDDGDSWILDHQHHHHQHHHQDPEQIVIIKLANKLFFMITIMMLRTGPSEAPGWGSSSTNFAQRQAFGAWYMIYDICLYDTI